MDQKRKEKGFKFKRKEKGGIIKTIRAGSEEREEGKGGRKGSSFHSFS